VSTIFHGRFKELDLTALASRAPEGHTPHMGVNILLCSNFTAAARGLALYVYLLSPGQNGFADT